jgi:hypothetical protein
MNNHASLVTKTVAYRAYFLLASLEGIAALVFLSRERSMERNVWLLGYSAPRLALGVVTLVALVVLILLTLKAIQNDAWLAKVIGWSDRQASRTNRLLILSAGLLSFILVAGGTLAAFSSSHPSDYLPYMLLVALERTHSSVIWALVLAIQTQALLIVIYRDAYRHKILRDPRTYVIPAVAGMIAFAAVVRLLGVGDPRLSVATSDTYKIIRASRIPLPTWDFLTSNRTPTVALIYKILEPAEGYSIVRVSQPAVSGTDNLSAHQGLYRVANFQVALAMLSWSTLAVVIARHLRYPLAKILGALLVLLLATSPQLADWDRILMSESISFSLFALVLALTLEMSIRIAHIGRQQRFQNSLLAGTWLIAVLFWVFSRDSNAYLLPVTIGMLLLALLVPRLRQQLALMPLLIIIALLSVMLVIHSVTLHRSDRWVNPFLNNLIHNVLPYEPRVAFFERHGMPVTDELLAFQTSRGNERGFLELQTFMQWVEARGDSTYTLFLLNEYQWTLTTLVDNLDMLFSENIQPYFRKVDEGSLPWLSSIGDQLHPTSASTILLDAVLTLAVWIAAFRSRDRTILTIGWMFVWLILAEFAMLFVSFHGDSLGVTRHTIAAVMPFRLSLWMLSVFALDQSISLAGLRKSSRSQHSPV